MCPEAAGRATLSVRLRSGYKRHSLSLDEPLCRDLMILFTRFYDPGSARKLILADPLHSILYDVFGVDLMAIENHVLVMRMLS